MVGGAGGGGGAVCGSLLVKGVWKTPPTAFKPYTSSSRAQPMWLPVWSPGHIVLCPCHQQGCVRISGLASVTHPVPARGQRGIHACYDHRRQGGATQQPSSALQGTSTSGTPFMPAPCDPPQVPWLLGGQGVPQRRKVSATRPQSKVGEGDVLGFCL